MIELCQMRFFWARNDCSEVHIFGFIANVEGKIEASSRNYATRSSGTTVGNTLQIEKVNVESKQISSIVVWSIHKKLPCIWPFESTYKFSFKDVGDVISGGVILFNGSH